MRKDALHRREKILEAAINAYMRRQETLTMDEIAIAADVGIATVYRNFPTREELIAEVLATITQRLTGGIKEATIALSSGDTDADDVMDHLLELMSESEVDRLLTHIINRDPGQLSPAHAALHQEYARHLQRLLDTYRERGGISPGIDNDTFLRGLLGCFTAARATENLKTPLPPDTIARIFLLGATQ